MSTMSERYIIHIGIDHLMFHAFSFPGFPHVGKTEAVEIVCVGSIRRMVNCMHRDSYIGSLRENSSIGERESVWLDDCTIHRGCKRCMEDHNEERCKSTPTSSQAVKTLRLSEETINFPHLSKGDFCPSFFTDDGFNFFSHRLGIFRIGSKMK